jgi:hypothetical protein
MEIVDAVKIKVFFMPAEHSLPRAEVDIGIINSQYFLIS